MPPRQALQMTDTLLQGLGNALTASINAAGRGLLSMIERYVLFLLIALIAVCVACACLIALGLYFIPYFGDFLVLSCTVAYVTQEGQMSVSRKSALVLLSIVAIGGLHSSRAALFASPVPLVTQQDAACTDGEQADARAAFSPAAHLPQVPHVLAPRSLPSPSAPPPIQPLLSPPDCVPSCASRMRLAEAIAFHLQGGRNTTASVVARELLLLAAQLWRGLQRAPLLLGPRGTFARDFWMLLLPAVAVAVVSVLSFLWPAIRPIARSLMRGISTHRAHLIRAASTFTAICCCFAAAAAIDDAFTGLWRHALHVAAVIAAMPAAPLLLVARDCVMQRHPRVQPRSRALALSLFLFALAAALIATCRHIAATSEPPAGHSDQKHSLRLPFGHLRFGWRAPPQSSTQRGPSALNPPPPLSLSPLSPLPSAQCAHACVQAYIAAAVVSLWAALALLARALDSQLLAAAAAMPLRLVTALYRRARTISGLAIISFCFGGRTVSLWCEQSVSQAGSLAPLLPRAFAQMASSHSPLSCLHLDFLSSSTWPGSESGLGLRGTVLLTRALLALGGLQLICVDLRLPFGQRALSHPLHLCGVYVARAYERMAVFFAALCRAAIVATTAISRAVAGVARAASGQAWHCFIAARALLRLVVRWLRWRIRSLAGAGLFVVSAALVRDFWSLRGTAGCADLCAALAVRARQRGGTPCASAFCALLLHRGSCIRLALTLATSAPCAVMAMYLCTSDLAPVTLHRVKESAAVRALVLQLQKPPPPALVFVCTGVLPAWIGLWLQWRQVRSVVDDEPFAPLKPLSFSLPPEIIFLAEAAAAFAMTRVGVRNVYRFLASLQHIAAAASALRDCVQIAARTIDKALRRLLRASAQAIAKGASFTCHQLLRAARSVMRGCASAALGLQRRLRRLLRPACALASAVALRMGSAVWSRVLAPLGTTAETHWPLLALCSSCVSFVLFTRATILAALARQSSAVVLLFGAATALSSSIVLAGHALHSPRLLNVGNIMLARTGLGVCAAISTLMRVMGSAADVALRSFRQLVSTPVAALFRVLYTVAATLAAVLSVHARHVAAMAWRAIVLAVRVAIVWPVARIVRSPGLSLLASFGWVLLSFWLHRKGMHTAALAFLNNLAAAATKGAATSSATGSIVFSSATTSFATATAIAAAHAGTAASALSSWLSLVAATQLRSIESAWASASTLHAHAPFALSVSAIALAASSTFHPAAVPPRALAAAQLALVGFYWSGTPRLLPLALCLACAYVVGAAAAAGTAARERELTARRLQQTHQAQRRSEVASALASAPLPTRLFHADETCAICLEAVQLPNVASAQAAGKASSQGGVNVDVAGGRVSSAERGHGSASPVSASSADPGAPKAAVGQTGSALRCGHVFHVDCISQWLAMSNVKRCPTCREHVRWQRSWLESSLFVDR